MLGPDAMPNHKAMTAHLFTLHKHFNNGHVLSDSGKWE